MCIRRRCRGFWRTLMSGEETEAKYRYVMEPLDASVSENIVKLRARLTGDFPGSPVEPDYTFTVANDKIILLEIK